MKLKVIGKYIRNWKERCKKNFNKSLFTLSIILIIFSGGFALISTISTPLSSTSLMKRYADVLNGLHYYQEKYGEMRNKYYEMEKDYYELKRKYLEVVNKLRIEMNKNKQKNKT